MLGTLKQQAGESAVCGAIVIYGRPGITTSLLENALGSAGSECVVCDSASELLSRDSFRDAIVFVDCSELTAFDAFALLDELDALDEKPLVAVANVRKDQQAERFLQWANVRGIFHQNESPYYLLKGVCAILSGESWFPRGLLEDFVEKYRNLHREIQPVSLEEATKAKGLTRREREILELVTTGASNNEIAEILCLSPHTIKTHLYNLFRKLDVENRLQAANWATEYFPADSQGKSAAGKVKQVSKAKGR